MAIFHVLTWSKCCISMAIFLVLTWSKYCISMAIFLVLTWSKYCISPRAWSFCVDLELGRMYCKIGHDRLLFMSAHQCGKQIIKIRAGRTTGFKKVSYVIHFSPILALSSSDTANSVVHGTKYSHLQPKAVLVLTPALCCKV